jgi:hypothetical protein
MKKINIRIFTVLFAVFLCITIFPATAFAGGGEEEIPLILEVTEMTKPAKVPLTPDGNLTLVDDIAGEQAEDKQFVTLVSKNGNYFYLIIDRAGDKENVHFLNLVDEADLLALIEGEIPKQQQAPQLCNCTDLCEDGKVDTNCPLCRNDLTKCTGKTSTPTPVTEPTEEKGNGAGGTLLLLLIVGMIGGAFYYFKVLKSKQNTKGNTALEEYDFEDDEDTDEDEYEKEYEVDDEEESEADSR